VFRNSLNSKVWLLLWLLVTGAALLSRPPLPVDETRYLSVAWEMWRDHHFLVPRLNGLPYSHKPPLLFWLIHLGWLVFGVNSWSARLSAPLFALATMLLTLFLGRRLWPDREQVVRLLPWFFLGNLFWLFYSSLTLFDMLPAFWALAASHFLWSARKENRLRSWLGFGLATGLGVLSKGPVILIYVLPQALAAPWWTNAPPGGWRRWYGSLVLSLSLALMIILSWALPAARAGGPEYGRAIFYGQTAGRLVHAFAHQRPWYWYLPLFPLLLFPWSAVLDLWRHPLSEKEEAGRFCLTAVGPGLILLSLVSGKQVHYLLPLLPPLFLLLARKLDTPPVGPWNRLPALFLVLFAAALFTVSGSGPFAGAGGIPGSLPAWPAVAPLLVAVILLRTPPERFVPALGLSGAGLLFFFHLVFSGPVHDLFDVSRIATLVRRAQEQGRPVAVWPARLAGQIGFAGRLPHPLVVHDTLEQGVLWSEKHRRAWFLIGADADKADYFVSQGISHRFADRWLILCPAWRIPPAYFRWAAAQEVVPPPGAKRFSGTRLLSNRRQAVMVAAMGDQTGDRPAGQ